MTLDAAENTIRQLWTLLLSARYGALQPGEEEEVRALCHQLIAGIPGRELFNRAAQRLCERLTSVKNSANHHDFMRVDGLINEVDYLRALVREARGAAAPSDF